VGCTKAICSAKQIGGVRVMRIEEKSAREDDTDLSNRDAASAGGERDCRGMNDLYSRASVKRDSQLPSPREKARPSRQGLLDRRCNRRADDYVCLASAPDRERLLGSSVENFPSLESPTIIQRSTTRHWVMETLLCHLRGDYWDQWKRQMEC